MKRPISMLALVAAFTLIGGQAVPAAEPGGRTVRTVATFENVDGVPGVPEGLTADGAGGLYVSLFARDEVWHIDPASGETTFVADVPGGGVVGDLIGIDRDPRDGTIIAAFKKAEGVDIFDPTHPDCRDTSDTVTGLYRLDPATGEVAPFATRGTGVPMCFPDDPAVDASGNVYVSDLTLGLIWKFDAEGRGTVWSDDPLLGWTEQTGTWNSEIGAPLGHIGVNGIALAPDGHTLFAGTDGGPGGPTGSGLLVRIPIEEDGSAGPADLFASGLGANDGLEVGPDGTIYFADTFNSDIWAFSPEGDRRLLVASAGEFGDPLDNATSLVLLDGCLYNTQLGFFKLQQGLVEETLRSVVEICGFGDPATDGSYTPPPVRTVEPETPHPPSSRPDPPLQAYVVEPAAPAPEAPAPGAAEGTTG